MDALLNPTILGQLEILETFEYYDQPVLFSCRNAAGHLYLVVAADENEQHDTWLYAGVSEERLRLIRSGAIDLHDAFADPEDGCLIQAIVPYGDQGPPQFKSIPANETPTDLLPVAGECLNLKTDTLPELGSPEEIAKSRKQEILHLTLNFDGVFMTEAPAGALSKIISTLQDVIYTIGMIRSGSSQITEEIRRKMGISLIGVGAGSFDIRLASTDIVDLLSHSEFGDTIEDFLELLNAGSNQEELKRPLGRLKSRVAENYAKFLKSLNECVNHTKLIWTSPNSERGGTAYLSESQIRDAIEIIERVLPETPTRFSISGTLVGASLNTKRFELKTTDELYTGDVSDQAIEAISSARINGEYIARIEEIVERRETTDEFTKPKYLLLSLSE